MIGHGNDFDRQFPDPSATFYRALGSPGGCTRHEPLCLAHARTRRRSPVAFSTPVPWSLPSLAPPSTSPCLSPTTTSAYSTPSLPKFPAVSPSTARRRIAPRPVALYLDKSSPHPLPPGSDIRSVYLVDPGLAVIDVNAAFADGHRSGVLAEELTVASLIQTLSANIPGILESENSGGRQTAGYPGGPCRSIELLRRLCR